MTTPHDVLAQTAQQALLTALDVTTNIIDTTTSEAERDAAWGCRMLLIGALTDQRVTSTQAWTYVRRHLRDMAHGDASPRGALAMYRLCLRTLDGKG